MGAHDAIEVAKTVLEVADVAWTAVECHHHLHGQSHHDSNQEEKKFTIPEDELEPIRQENQRLRSLLKQNLKLLQDLSESPSFLNDCPPDVRSSILLLC